MHEWKLNNKRAKFFFVCEKDVDAFDVARSATVHNFHRVWSGKITARRWFGETRVDKLYPDSVTNNRTCKVGQALSVDRGCCSELALTYYGKPLKTVHHFSFQPPLYALPFVSALFSFAQIDLKNAPRFVTPNSDISSAKSRKYWNTVLDAEIYAPAIHHAFSIA